MKRYISLLALAPMLFLLYACGHMELKYQDTPDVSASGSATLPTLEPTPQESAYPAASESPVIPSDNNAPPEQSPQASPEASPTPAESTAPATPEDTQAESSPGAPPPAAQESAAPAVEPTPEQSTAPNPEPASTDGQPPLLTQMVSKAGLSFDDIDFSQLILVASDGPNAELFCYDKGADGLWQLADNLGYIKGYSGRNGISLDKYEGDGCSPGGLFGVGFAFGNNPKPTTGLEYRPITKDTYWIDDPNSKYYNQWAEGADDADWTSGEKLSVNVVSYAYAIVIEYNTAPDTVAGKGSAIFLHIGDKPTSGCITVTKDTLLKILKWLSAANDPHILIISK